MQLVDIHLHNFRAIKQTTIHFAPQRTIIVGDNGTGKTTILEAIHLLAMGRSFRTSKHAQLVQEKSAGYRVMANLKNESRTLTLQAAGLPDGTRRMWIDGAPVDKLRDILGQLPAVTMIPEDISLLQGPDQQRRAFIDRVLGTTNRRYLEALVAYRHVLRQRNGALRQSGAPWAEVEIWNAPLVEHADSIWRQRKTFMQVFGRLFSEAWAGHGLDLKADLTYEPPAYANAADYTAHLLVSFAGDARLGRTSSGPHRDRLTVSLDRRPARTYASMGELKLLLATFKLAESRYVQQSLGQAPVILMDDLFATLDPGRAAMVLEELSGDHQVVITTAALEGPLRDAAGQPGTEIVHCSREALWPA